MHHPINSLKIRRDNLFDDNQLCLFMDLRHGIAGGIAGIAVDFFYYPLDTIKTRIMASSVNENLTKIAQSKFKGFSCQLIVSFPSAFSFFYVYEKCRAYFTNPLRNIIAAITAEVVSNVIRNPFEVVKQQLMVNRSEGMRKSIQQILNLKGWRGMYTGFKSTIARDMLFSACQLSLFQAFRETNFFQLSSVTNAAVSGSIAAFIAGFVSCPLDVIKTRLMTQNMNQQSLKNFVQLIYKERGIKGYFVGVSVRCFSLALGGILYFGALQQARLFLKIQ